MKKHPSQMKLQERIEDHEKGLIYNRRQIFKRAHYLCRNDCYMTFSEALKQCWKEAKEYRARLYKELDSMYHQLSLKYTPKFSKEYNMNFLYRSMAAAHKSNGLGRLD